MRASSLRSHHSIGAATVNCPRSTVPSASRRSTAASISDSGKWTVRASQGIWMGPECASQPRTSFSVASGFVEAGSSISAGRVSNSAEGKRVEKVLALSAATQNFASPTEARAPRLSLRSRRKRSPHCAATGEPAGDVKFSGKATRTWRTSLNSSASRTSGHASSRTCAIAAGSSRPISESTVSGRLRRRETARARRSSSGASSRYA